MDESSFSKTTFLWLSRWLSGGKEIESLPNDVKDELICLNLLEGDYDIKLFRGLLDDSLEAEGKDVYVVFNDFPSSWTYSNEIAGYFSNIVISTKVNSIADILIDTTRLDMKKFGGVPDEVEVILLPGRYLTNLSLDQLEKIEKYKEGKIYNLDMNNF
uniref:Uncharacterized protein n=1 Tax=Pithovirus LCPAC403 TaxID=2506596 RepID=A0A481ZD93_9VIRU|nr:MAG: hypothetical protein LCPAC403_04160 [Pithovirus LCPAC403]